MTRSEDKPSLASGCGTLFVINSSLMASITCDRCTMPAIFSIRPASMGSVQKDVWRSGV